MTNPMDLWAVWVRGWLRAADGLVEAQRAWLQQVGGATERTRQKADRTEDEARRMAEAVARMQADLALAGSKPATALRSDAPVTVRLLGSSGGPDPSCG